MQLIKKPKRNVFSCNVDSDTMNHLGKIAMDLGYVYGLHGKTQEARPHWGKFFRAIVNGEIILAKPVAIPK